MLNPSSLVAEVSQMKQLLSSLAVIILCSVVALAQNPVSADSPFQVRYASNLPIGDSVINITNTGASSTNAFPNSKR